MRRFLGFFLSLMLLSCSGIVDKPTNLVSNKKMAEIIADLAINDQLGVVLQGYNVESQVQATFSQHKVSPKDFLNSYKYYIATNKIESIYSESQELILEKDPKAKEYILKQTQGEGASKRTLDDRELQVQPQN